MPVTPQEVKQMVFSLNDNKAPRHDGYGSGFFKDAWSVIGEGITNVVLEFFENGALLKQLNSTQITLVPKVEAPKTTGDFRPIAFCNTLYKVISKLLCTRLSGVLPHLVSSNQSAFIEGRSIIENILICQDLIKYYKRSNASPRCLLKIDLRKAYDTIS